MGVVATFGVQFFKRLELLFMAPSQHPYIEYLDNVSIAELLLHTWRFPRHTRDTAVSVGLAKTTTGAKYNGWEKMQISSMESIFQLIDFSEFDGIDFAIIHGFIA